MIGFFSFVLFWLLIGLAVWVGRSIQRQQRKRAAQLQEERIDWTARARASEERVARRQRAVTEQRLLQQRPVAPHQVQRPPQPVDRTDPITNSRRARELYDPPASIPITSSLDSIESETRRTFEGFGGGGGFSGGGAGGSDSSSSSCSDSGGSWGGGDSGGGCDGGGGGD